MTLKRPSQAAPRAPSGSSNSSELKMEPDLSKAVQAALQRLDDRLSELLPDPTEKSKQKVDA